MMGRTHAGTGVLAAVALGAGLYMDVPSVILAVSLYPGFALFPDIDHARATASNTFGIVTRTFSRVLGHRRETHSVPGILMLAFITYMAVLYPGNVLGRTWLTFILVIGWASVLRLIPLKSFKGKADEAVAISIAIAVVWFPGALQSAGFPEFPLSVLPGALAVGMLVHLVGDIITKQGCPVFWPFSSKRLAFKVFKAGGRFEHSVMVSLVIAGTVWFTYVWIMGMAGAALSVLVAWSLGAFVIARSSWVWITRPARAARSK